MEIRQITEDLYAVAPQIGNGACQADQGGGLQGASSATDPIRRTARCPMTRSRRRVREAGMEFRFIPVVSGQMTEKDVADQAAALDELPNRCGLLPLGRALPPISTPWSRINGNRPLPPWPPGAQPGVLNTEVASGTA